MAGVSFKNGCDHNHCDTRSGVRGSGTRISLTFIEGIRMLTIVVIDNENSAPLCIDESNDRTEYRPLNSQR